MSVGDGIEAADSDRKPSPLRGDGHCLPRDSLIPGSLLGWSSQTAGLTALDVYRST